MLGFFDLPTEIRYMIWHEAVASIGESKGDCLYVDTWTRLGNVVVAEPVSDEWQWLQSVSLVSRRFAAEGRRFFFSAWKDFSICDIPRSGPAQNLTTPGMDVQFPTYKEPVYADLRWFLRSAGKNAPQIRNVIVRYCYHSKSRRTSRKQALNALDAMGLRKMKLQKAKIHIRYFMDAREGDASHVFQMDNSGRFHFVDTA